MRRIVNFNDNWKLEGEAVALPHTWNAADGQDGGNDYFRGTKCYTKEFASEEIDRMDEERVFLEFQGVALTAQVKLNGEEIACHEDGFSTFRIDITDNLKDNGEKNVLEVFADNSESNRVYPQKADFTFYGGIYRDVNLVYVQEKHFELVKDGTSGLKLTPEVHVSEKTAEITCEAWSNAPGENVHFEIYAPASCGASYWRQLRDGNFGTEEYLISDAEKAGEITVQADANGYVSAKLSMESIRLWNGVNDPYMYVVKASLKDADEGDCVYTRIGLRTLEFSPENGFFLNGVSYPLRGVSRHQDRAGVGNALTKEMHEEDMDIILEIGANTVRLAHYQQAQYFYDLCDEAGLVVWAEIPYITMHMPAGRENTLLQMRELVTQSYHHPSIVCWGLSNEITAASPVSEDMLENHRLLNDLCHEMDTTRPTTMAHVFMLETDSPLIDIADIGSYNLYFGWYLGELTQNEEFFDKYRAEHPNRVIGFSEYGADANPQYQEEAPDRGDYTESYQCIYHEHMIDMIEKRPYLWATHVWNLFDFAADGRDEGGKHGVNQKGLVTIDRKLKKDPFYLYKAHWSKVPFVHICGRRFEERTGSFTEIKAYSNCDRVTFYVNGEEIPEITGAYVFRSKVALNGDMKITAKAVASDGTEVEDEINIRKVSEENPSYRMAAQQEVVNWFDQEEIDPDCFSIDDTIGDICQDPTGNAIIMNMIKKASESRGDVAKSTQGNDGMMKMLSRMKVSAILKQAGEALSKEEIQALNRALQGIRKPAAEPQRTKLVLDADSRLEEIFAHEESTAVFDRILPGMRERVEGQKATLGFSLRKLIAYSKGAIPESVLSVMEAEFGKLEIYVEGEVGYTEEQPFADGGKERKEPETFSAVYPGRPWFDTEGKRIQAHGGAVFYENGTYYWYGENKDRTDGKCPVWTWGIRAYASTDLYNWKDLGLIIEPNLKDKKAGMYPEKHVDRPHIVKSSTTGKYVCWIKQSGEEACFNILEADAFIGPYTVVQEEYRPLGYKVGDFDILQTEEGTFLFMDADHEGVVGIKLSDDLHEAQEIVSWQYKGLHAPFCREGVTLFERNGKFHMLTSGMSGYVPNKSDSAEADSITASFTVTGDPHVNDASKASFNSQISQVFKVQGKKDLYIAVADRWVPNFPVDARIADIMERSIAGHYEPEKYSVTPEEQQIVMNSPMLESADTSIADYVWLPVTFTNGRPEIAWRDSWTTEEFENE